jgi:predicted nucleic acid-binding protein
MVKIRAFVVADAGPIIHLDELGCLDILSDFEQVSVPEAVWREISHHRPHALAAFPALFVRVSPRTLSPLVTALTPLYSLHHGEQEALHVSMESRDTLLLTDDTAARLAAKALSIAAHGTLGLLVRAIRQKTRSRGEVLALLRAIPTQTTLHIRPSLLAEMITEVETRTST